MDAQRPYRRVAHLRKASFTLTGSEKRHTWGQDVVAEFWDLKL